MEVAPPILCSPSRIDQPQTRHPHEPTSGVIDEFRLRHRSGVSHDVPGTTKRSIGTRTRLRERTSDINRFAVDVNRTQWNVGGVNV